MNLVMRVSTSHESQLKHAGGTRWRENPDVLMGSVVRSSSKAVGDQASGLRCLVVPRLCGMCLAGFVVACGTVCPSFVLWL